ncbi:MAG: substrate-binding domain-containing protein [Planctomycetota bacterium]|jgi:DNA-binding LacI/PurR family transcriptional regulator
MDSVSFRPSRSAPLYSQVIGWIEGQIDSGELAPGMRIPSTDALAAELGVGRKVIQQALAALSERGMLERAPGRGTFVARSLNTGQIAVYFPTNLLTGESFGFYRLICSACLHAAHERGITPLLFFPTSREDEERCLREMQELSTSGRLQAILNFGESDFSELRIPCIRATSALGGQGRPSGSPRESLLFRGLTYLFSRGYEHIGVMTHSPGSSKRETETVMETVAAAMADHAVEARVTHYPAHITDSERNGRLVMGTILSGDDRPEAMLILDDNLAREAIFTMLEQGVKIPKDMAVMTHSNRGSPILSPVPLTVLELDPELLGKAAIDALCARLEGVPHTPATHQARLIVGRSCGES